MQVKIDAEGTVKVNGYGDPTFFVSVPDVTLDEYNKRDDKPLTTAANLYESYLLNLMPVSTFRKIFNDNKLPIKDLAILDAIPIVTIEAKSIEQGLLRASSFMFRLFQICNFSIYGDAVSIAGYTRLGSKMFIKTPDQYVSVTEAVANIAETNIDSDASAFFGSFVPYSKVSEAKRLINKIQKLAPRNLRPLREATNLTSALSTYRKNYADLVEERRKLLVQIEDLNARIREVLGYIKFYELLEPKTENWDEVEKKINNLNFIKRFSYDADGDTLVFEFKELAITYGNFPVYLGELVVSVPVNLFTSSSLVTSDLEHYISIENKTFSVRYAAQFSHPHVTNSEPCFGPIGVDIVQAIKERDLLKLAGLLYTYLTSINEGEAIGVLVGAWPRMVSYAGKLRLAVFNMHKVYFYKNPALDIENGSNILKAAAANAPSLAEAIRWDIRPWAWKRGKTFKSAWFSRTVIGNIIYLQYKKPFHTLGYLYSDRRNGSDLYVYPTAKIHPLKDRLISLNSNIVLVDKMKESKAKGPLDYTFFELEPKPEGLRLKFKSTPHDMQDDIYLNVGFSFRDTPYNPSFKYLGITNALLASFGLSKAKSLEDVFDIIDEPNDNDMLEYHVIRNVGTALGGNTGVVVTAEEE